MPTGNGLQQQTQTTAGYFPTGRPLESLYANKVEVERGEHDSVLRFLLVRGETSKKVREITVPNGVMDALRKGAK